MSEEGKYCERSCIVCVSVTTLFMLLINVAIMAAFTYLLEGEVMGTQVDFFPEDYGLNTRPTLTTREGVTTEAEAEAVATKSAEQGGAVAQGGTIGKGEEPEETPAPVIEYYEPKITRTIEFGSSSYAYTHEFPSPENKLEFVKGTTPSLSELTFAIDGSLRMTQAKFEFSDGQALETNDSANWANVATKPIDEAFHKWGAIRKVNMCIWEGAFVGITLTDSVGNTVLPDKEWKWGALDVSSKKLANKKAWQGEKSISADETILGFKVAIRGGYIRRFAW